MLRSDDPTLPRDPPNDPALPHDPPDDPAPPRYSIAADGLAISEGPPLFDPAPYSDELAIYAAALAELEDLSPADFRARYIDYRDIGGLVAHCRGVLASPPMQQRLFLLGRHGIFKSAGAGGVCALVKTEPQVQQFARQAAPAGVMQPGNQLFSSWDSVNYLGPTCVTEDPHPEWLHRDVRLGVDHCDGIQLMLNLSASAQDGPAGDACFVFSPGTHTITTTETTLRELNVPEANIKKAFSQDFVKLSALTAAANTLSFAKTLSACVIWPAGAALHRAVLPSGAAIAWDSRLFHSGSLFARVGDAARQAKYVHYFTVTATSPRAIKLAATKTKQFLKAMVTATGIDAYHHPLYPIAVTTAHRGTKKNNSGKFDTFRTGKRERKLVELNEKLEDPAMSNFFSLPYMLARAIHLQFPVTRRLSPHQLAEECRSAIVGIYIVVDSSNPRPDYPQPSLLETTEPAAFVKCRRLAALHGF